MDTKQNPEVFTGDKRFFESVIALSKRFTEEDKDVIANTPELKFKISELMSIPAWKASLVHINALIVTLWKLIHNNAPAQQVQPLLSEIIYDLLKTKLLLEDRNKISSEMNNLPIKNPNTADYWNKVYKKEKKDPWRDYPEKFFNIVRKLIPPSSKAPLKILDVGCGQGILLDQIHKEYPDHKLLGIDISSEAVAQTKARGIKAEVVKVPPIPKANESYDIVIACELLEHMDPSDAYRFLVEAKRILKPNGFLIASVPNNILPPYIEKEHRARYNEKSFKDLCESVFSSVKEYSMKTHISSKYLEDPALTPFLVSQCFK